MKKARLLALVLSGALLLAGCGGSGGGEDSTAAETTNENAIQVATLSQIDAWPAWAAKADGSAKDLGIEYELKLYEAGIPMVEDLATKKWNIGDAGAVPTMLGVLNRNATIIGVASDESAANAVLAKANNPVFNMENENGTYGDAESVRGKAIYTTFASSAHYVANNYLKSIGLTEKDVNLQNASQADCLQALEDGTADFVVLWAPHLYEAEAAGAKVVASGKDVVATNYMFYLADKDWAAEHQNEVAAFLAATSAKVVDYQTGGEDNDADITKFFNDFAKIELGEGSLEAERNTHDLFTVDEQLAMIESGDAARGMEDIARFFMDINKLAESNYGRLVKQNFNIDDTYLKLAQEMNQSENPDQGQNE